MTRPKNETIRRAVSDRYGSIAESHLADSPTQVDASCCGPSASEATSCCGETESTTATTSSWADSLYDARTLGDVDTTVAGMTLGCGNPLAIAELNPGETVLDLGSGAGLDCFIASKQVGPAGRVIGVDMTDSMLALAERNLAKVGTGNVSFRKGYLEELPVEAASVDVILSNCVINLTVDKGAALREAFRVLKPGGRFRVSDIVWTRVPTPKEQSDLASWAGCVAGALTATAFERLLGEAGFTDISLDLADGDNPQGWTSASIRGRRPAVS